MRGGRGGAEGEGRPGFACFLGRRRRSLPLIAAKRGGRVASFWLWVDAFEKSQHMHIYIARKLEE